MVEPATLPDAVLKCILPYLPVRDRARSALVSRTWRSLLRAPDGEGWSSLVFSDPTDTRYGESAAKKTEGRLKWVLCSPASDVSSSLIRTAALLSKTTVTSIVDLSARNSYSCWSMAEAVDILDQCPKLQEFRIALRVEPKDSFHAIQRLLGSPAVRLTQMVIGDGGAHPKTWETDSLQLVWKHIKRPDARMQSITVLASSVSDLSARESASLAACLAAKPSVTSVTLDGVDWANALSNVASARVGKPRALVARGCFADDGACAAVARSAGAGRLHKVSLTQVRPLVANAGVASRINLGPLGGALTEFSCALTSLSLDSNRGMLRGYSSLLEQGLGGNINLRALSLCNCGLEDEHVTALAVGTRTKKNLEDLLLSHNDFTSDCLLDLAEVARNSRDIVKFHFFVGQQRLVGLDNAAGVDKLTDALRLSHLLREFPIDIEISHAAASAIVNGLRPHNIALRYLTTRSTTMRFIAEQAAKFQH